MFKKHIIFQYLVLYIKACQHILLHQTHKIMIFKKASYDPFKDKIQNWILSNVLKKNKSKFTEFYANEFINKCTL